MEDDDWESFYHVMGQGFSAEEVIRSVIGHLIMSYGREVVAKETRAVFEEQLKPGSRHRPTRAQMRMSVWCAIEAERRRRGIKGVRRTIEALFKDLRGGPWYVGHPFDGVIEIKTVATAHDYHSEGQKQMTEWGPGHKRYKIAQDAIEAELKSVITQKMLRATYMLHNADSLAEKRAKDRYLPKVKKTRKRKARGS